MTCTWQTTGQTPSLIQQTSNAVVSNVSVGHEPVSVMYDGVEQSVFVANFGSGTVSAISAPLVVPPPQTPTSSATVQSGSTQVSSTSTGSQTSSGSSSTTGTTSTQPSIVSSNEAVFGIDHERDSGSRGWAGSLFQKESVESVILRA